MSRNSTLGLIGGVLIAVTVFLSGNTITFSGDALKATESIVLFAAGIAVIAFSLGGNREGTGYAATVAGTFALVQVINVIRYSSYAIDVRLVVLSSA